MDAPVAITQLAGTETLWFAGETCRTCGQPATHYWVRQVSPDRWIEGRQVILLHTPYCTDCGPTIADWAKTFQEPERPSWWRRLLRVTV